VIAPPSDPRAAAWFEAGVRASPTLAGHASAVVVGRDADAAAWVALGLARAIAPIRRVALGDLIGDAAPIIGLLGEPPAEGIVDSFLYGVSLNRIAREVAGLGNCYLLPSGSEHVQREDIIASDRWKRLAVGFGEVGATLLLVTTADAPGLDALVEHVGGAVCVGADVLLGPGTTTIATVLADIKRAAPAKAPEPVVARRPTADFRAVLDGAMQGGPAAAPRPPVPPGPPQPRRGPEPAGARPRRPGPEVGGWSPPPAQAARRENRRWLVPALLFAAALAAGAALSLWRVRVATDRTDPGVARDSVAAQTEPAVVPEAPPAADSARDSLPPEPPLEVANPADSLLAAGWAVELVTANTEGGARVRAIGTPEQPTSFPAATWAPATIGASRTLWFKAFAGALVTRTAAESLLAQLRRRRTLAADQGRIVRVPFAFRLAGDVPSDSVTAYVSGFSGLGLPAYALRRTDGTAEVLSGAFESPQQAALHVPALRAARVEPVLVYRTGGAF
jgi:hypothetical protein